MVNKVIQRAHQPEPYTNRNFKVIQDSFDPIRVKLKIIPIAKAFCAKGKNADFYFIEAGKKAK